MVEVLKTTVRERDVANIIIHKLLELFPYYGINFDLEDCDRILRIEGENIDLDQIINLVQLEGYYCEVLT